VQNAGLHNNLGNAYLSLSFADPASVSKNLRRASRHFDRALRLCTSVDCSSDYAITQFNRGTAFLRLALEEHNPQSSLRAAELCFGEAAVMFTQCGLVEHARRAHELAESARSSLRMRAPVDAQEPSAQQQA